MEMYEKYLHVDYFSALRVHCYATGRCIENKELKINSLNTCSNITSEVVWNILWISIWSVIIHVITKSDGRTAVVRFIYHKYD